MKHIRRKVIILSLITILILGPIAILIMRSPRGAEAAWWDDSYAYRQLISFVHNADITSDRRVTITVNTATLITAGKMQSDCDDTRFTDINGRLLRYQLLASPGCNNSATTYDVVFPSIYNTENNAYIYYANPAAISASEDVSSVTSLTPSGAITVDTETKGPSPQMYLKFDEGYGATTQDQSSNNNDASLISQTATIEQQINLIDQEFTTTVDSYTPTDNSLGLIRWDGSKYNGETVYFEAIAYETTANGGQIALFDSSGTQVTGSELSAVAAPYNRLRSAAITLTDGTDYTVRARHTSTNGAATLLLKSARLIVVQSSSTGITDTQTQVEMGNNEASTGTGATQLTNPKIYQFDSTKFTPAPTAYFEASLASGSTALEQQINLIDQEFTTTVDSYTPTDNSLGLIRWDGSKYNGETVYFEAIAYETTANGGQIALFDSSGTQVTGSELSAVAAPYNRLRSAAITLTDGTDYTVRARHTSTNGAATLLLKSARLIVLQSSSTGITDTQTQVEMGNNETSTATSDTQLTNKKIYRYTSGAWSPGPSVYFEATLSNDTGGQTAFASLYTDGSSCTSQVSGSEVSVTGTTWSRVRSAAITLTGGTDYMVCIRASANTARIASAKIVFDQTQVGGIVAVETVQQSIHTLAIDTDATYTDQDFLNIFNATNYPGAVSYFYEATIKTSAGTGFAQLRNDSQALAITGSEVSTTSTSYTRVRSSALTDSNLTKHHESNMDTQLRNSAASGNTTSASNSWLIIQVSSMQPGTAYADLYNLTDGTQVTNSEVNTTSTSTTRVRSASLTLTTAKDYVVRTRTSSANSAVTIANAKIVFDQTQVGGIVAVETVQQSILTLATDTDATYTDQDYLNNFNATNYPGAVSYFFEATLKTSAGTAFAQLRNDTDGTAITGSEVSTTSTSYTRVRSGDITANMPSSAKNMDTQLRNSATNTTSAASSWLIIQVSSLTLVGRPSWKTEDLCLTEKCLFFDGSDDVATVTNASSIDLDAQLAGASTFQAWIRPNGAGEGSAGQIFFKGTNTWLRVDTLSGGKLDIEASLDLATTDATVNVSSAINDNTWNFVALSYTDDSDDEITIWVNGRSVGSSTNGDGAPATDTNNLLIGGTTTNNFQGFIDEVKYYNFAKSATQIQTESASRGTSKGVSAQFGNPDLGKILSNGLVGYWKMDESSGNATDSSGNTLTLTNNGTTTFTVGKFANASNHNGTTQYFNTATTISGVKTVAFWVNPASTTDNYLNLIASTAYVNSSSGTVTGTGFTSPAVYVNGVLNGSVTASVWNHVAITTTSAINASAFEVGRANGSYLTNTGKMDDVRVYNRALTPSEVSALYNWAPGPVGWWKLDDNTGTSAVDSSGKGNTGTLTLGPTWTQAKIGSGVRFDGSDDYIDFGDPASGEFDFGATDSFTVSFWFKTSASAPSDSAVMFSKYRSQGPTQSWYTSIRTTTQFPRFSIYDGTFNPGAEGTTAVNDGAWHHFVGIRNVTNDLLYLYIDGLLVNSVTDTTTGTLANSTRAVAGTLLNSTETAPYPTTMFNGLLDDMRIYNYARTTKQIIEDMNAGHPTGGSPIGSQTIYWKFDEQNGTTANDTVRNENGVVDANAAWKLENSCKLNGCLEFDAAAEEVLITDANDADINFNGSEPFSGSVWVNITTIPGSGEQDAIIAKWDGTTTARAYRLYVENDDADSTGNFEVQLMDQSAGQAITATQSNDQVSINTWYHVAFTFNGGQAGAAGDLKLYVDGKYTAQNSANASFLGLEDVAADFTIAEYDATDAVSTNTAFTGRVDEFKIYSSELTASEVLIDANAGSAAAMGGVLGTHDSEGFGGNPPVGWWKLDENTGNSSTVDSSGNGRTGTLNTFSANPWAAGKYGSALDFDGASDYVEVVSPNLPTGDFTYEAWVNLDTNSDERLFMASDGAGNNELSISIEGGGDIGIDMNGVFVVYFNTNISTGAWNHITVTRSGSSINAYKNGVKDTSTGTDGTTLNFSTCSLLIGTDADDTCTGSLGNYFDGRIDDVRLYNYARTQAQIAYDYNRGAPVAWYKFDECQGATANDSSLNANGATGGSNGTITPGSLGNTTAGSCNSGTATEMWDDGSVGKYNSSLGFDGSDDYITYGNTPARFQGLSTADFTVCAWIYPNTMGEGSLGTIISNYTDDGGGWSMLLREISGDVKSLQFSESRPLGQTDTLQISVDNTITLGAWQQVCAVYTKSANRAVLYKDAIQLSLQTDTAGTGTSETDADNELRVGNHSTDTTRTFDGKIDDIRIYNYALTTTQVKRLYNEGSGVKFGPQTGSP